MNKVDELIYYMDNGHVLPAALLVEQGLNLNRDTDGQGRLPLVTAIELSNLEMFKTLVSLGANVRNVARDYTSRTIHVKALQHREFAIADYIEAVMEQEPRKPHCYSVK